MNNLAIYQKRYQARPAKGIGLWLKIGEMLSITSVAVNCAVVFYTSEALGSILPVLDIKVDLIYQFMIMVAVEHVSIAIKLIMSVLIKDKPEWVAQEEKEAVEQRQVLQRVIEHRKSQYKEAGNEAIEDEIVLMQLQKMKEAKRSLSKMFTKSLREGTPARQ
jgi:hypothetical protein